MLPTDTEAPDPDLKAEADAANVAIRAPAAAMALKEGKTEVHFNLLLSLFQNKNGGKGINIFPFRHIRFHVPESTVIEIKP